MAADRDRFLLAKEGNEDALNELVEEHAGLVYAVAERFLHRGQEKEDLVQIGMIGLMKAIRGFDPEFGVKFSTYAVPVIMGEIRSFFRDDGIVKVSRKIRQQRRCIEKSVESLEQRFHRPPTLSEISEETGLSIEEIGLAKEASIVICPIEGEVERRLIGMRFYLDMSQSQVAQRLHVSQASVSRMEKKALKDLRRRLE